jgi:hypothetical protein
MFKFYVTIPDMISVFGLNVMHALHFFDFLPKTASITKKVVKNLL